VQSALAGKQILQPGFSGRGPRDSLYAAMLEPGFYPHAPAQVTHIETHISHLFLAGDVVYKVKKPVRYSFVDYSTLAKRKFFAQEELRLNRRLAPSVYLGILPISRDDHGWQLGGDANPAEYVLIMRRLPERRMLDFLLERGQVAPQMMAAVAEMVASFHSEAASTRRIRAFGHPSAVRRVWEENLDDIALFAGLSVEAGGLGAVRAFGDYFLRRHFDLMARRASEGRVREVHGDLHCEHVCFAPEGIQIFDCVEFNRKFRRCDAASEIAFLLMDLEYRGAAELGRKFLGHYLELTGDRELTELLPFYCCYRALVRGKVHALQDKRAAAKRFFDLAYDYARRPLNAFIVSALLPPSR
jgi:hypothetical protein